MIKAVQRCPDGFSCSPLIDVYAVPRFVLLGDNTAVNILIYAFLPNLQIPARHRINPRVSEALLHGSERKL